MKDSRFRGETNRNVRRPVVRTEGKNNMTASRKSDRPIIVLSTGAPKGGVSGCSQAFQDRIGRAVEVSFVTAPVLHKQVAEGSAQADVIVAPVARMDEFEAAGNVVPGIRQIVGSVKAGVVVREGAPAPDISSAESLKAAILAADSVVYNEATSGQYIVQMMKRLGIAETITDKVTTVPNGSAVMMHLAESTNENEIGFGQLTEIRVHEDRGVAVKLVGALPAAVENITTYCAAVFATAADPEAAKQLVAFIGSPEGQAICRATGLEPQSIAGRLSLES
jgi:molybdate transport system substrate-binding protein